MQLVKIAEPLLTDTAPPCKKNNGKQISRFRHSTVKEHDTPSNHPTNKNDNRKEPQSVQYGTNKIDQSGQPICQKQHQHSKSTIRHHQTTHFKQHRACFLRHVLATLTACKKQPSIFAPTNKSDNRKITTKYIHDGTNKIYQSGQSTYTLYIVHHNHHKMPQSQSTRPHTINMHSHIHQSMSRLQRGVCLPPKNAALDSIQSLADQSPSPHPSLDLF